MKKLLLLVFLLSIKYSQAQWVTIPDANFVTWLNQAYPSCMNGNQLDTTCSQIMNEDSVFVIYLSDLSGIEYFNNLTYLRCGPGYLTSINALPNNLETLNCVGNNITSIAALPNSLEWLECSNNQLTSLPNLSSGLVHLICDNNNLTNLPPLPNYLKNIFCWNNELMALPSLPDSLKSLQCSSNQLTALPSLPSSLISINCQDNLLSNLPSLPSSLKTLYFDNNFIINLPFLPNSLSALLASNNQLTSIPLLPDTMYRFDISNNNISCLNNLPYIDTLMLYIVNISNNPLTCVPNQTFYSLGLPLCIFNDPINNSNNCSSVVNIAGYVYIDLDSNCNYSNSDWNTENIPVKLFDSQNNLIAQSFTINGMYSFTALQPDTFQVIIDDIITPIIMACGQSNNLSVILDSTNQSLLSNNFPVVCDTAYDIKVISTHTQGLVFPGQTHLLKTNITDNFMWYNLNCNASIYSGIVTLEVTGPVTYISPASGALSPQVNGTTFTYNITDFNSLTPSSFGLNFMTDTTAVAGNQICVHVEINPTPIDADTNNNVYNFCYQVINSFDPNMKEVYPINVLPGYDDWLTYTIHFQNTGNAPAINIRLRDTLDTQLDLSTFEVLGYSHDATTTLASTILTVKFNNIMLPDSTSDYEGSMGYFQYRLKPLANLLLGTQIENTAYIYFDYNAPVITNTTQNNYDLLTSIQSKTINENKFILYPNPSNGIFNFKDNSNLKTVAIYNLLGEQILAQTNQKQIDLSRCSKGIYFAKINGNVVVKLVKE